MSRFDNYPGRPSFPGEGMDYDDSRCYRCGEMLPDEPEENTPNYNGYCSEACEKAQRDLPCVRPMFELLARETGTDPVMGWQRVVFEDVGCAVWMKFRTHESIVMGREERAKTHRLEWPFTREVLLEAVVGASQNRGGDAGGESVGQNRVSRPLMKGMTDAR